MRLFVLTALVMVAFAANSVLNRAALAGGWIGPMDFAFWRVASGALALALLVLARDRAMSLTGPRRVAGALSLSLYLLGFSAAYLEMDAGIGALILFGAVQITMFGGALAAGEPLPARRWIGAALAFCGLAWLLWPGGAAPVSVTHGLLMLAAGLGWGIYSLAGRAAGDPLRTTAANFVLAVPVCAAAWLLGRTGASSAQGVGLAVISGVVTSALGYALWYTVLPRLAASVAAVAQLTVPVIALAGGMVLLGEAVSLRLLLAGALVLFGVGYAVVPRRR